MTKGHRIQMVCGPVLQAEVIVETLSEAQNVWAKFCQLKYKRNLPYGGACISRADIPRYWNIPVGSNIRSTKGEN